MPTKQMVAMSIENLICLILLWISYVINEAFRNYIIIRGGVWPTEKPAQRPDYTLSFILRGMASILHGFLFEVEETIEYLPILIFQVTTFLVIFNPLLNRIRGFDFWYLGRNSGWIDKWLLRMGKAFYIVVYSCLVVISVLSIVVLYYRYV